MLLLRRVLVLLKVWGREREKVERRRFSEAKKLMVVDGRRGEGEPRKLLTVVDG